MGNPFLGVFFHWLGGLASGSFYVPYKGVRRWSWETYWLVGGFFSWIIAPVLLASLLSKDLFSVLSHQSAGTLGWTCFFQNYILRKPKGQFNPLVSSTLS